MIVPIVERLAQRYTTARRNQVIDGLLDSIEAQSMVVGYEHVWEGVSETGRVVRPSEPMSAEQVAERAAKARQVRASTMEGALQVIGLMVRNEKRARGLPLMPLPGESAIDDGAVIDRIA